MKTTEKQLNDLVKDICDITGLANNKQQAIKLGQDKYLQLNNASCYGGWRLCYVSVTNGANYGAFDGSSMEARLKAGEMAIKLRCLIAGIEYAKKAKL